MKRKYYKMTRDEIRNEYKDVTDDEIETIYYLSNAVMDDSWGVLYQENFRELVKCIEPIANI